MPNPNDPLKGRRTCPYCNSEIIEGSIFCIGCGRPIDQPDITPHNQGVNRLCPYCGRALRGNETFCNYCGNHLNKTEIDESKLRAKRSQNSNQHRNDRLPPERREPRRDLNSNGYQTNYLLIILFFLVIFTIFINGFLTIFLVIVSAIAIYYDAKNIINVQKREKSFASSSWSPSSWGLMTLLFWIIGHPLYLIKRRSIWEDNQVITNRYEQYKSNGSIGSVLAVVIILAVLLIIFSPTLSIKTGLFTPYSYTQSIMPTQSIDEKATSNDVSPIQTVGTTSTSKTNGVQPDTATWSEKNALNKALNYLAVMPFSYSGLVQQLKYEGYTNTEAVYGVDHCGADWNEQAALKAQNYLIVMPFSYSGLVQQLEYEGYTNTEAVYGADLCGADWNEQAALKAQNYLTVMPFSRDGLIDQLEYEGFTRAQAEYGVQAVGY